MTARWIVATSSRPRVRLAVAGGLLVIAGAWVVGSSVWTLPLVVVGVVMILIAWLGARLEGRFTIDWGAEGGELQLYARVKPPPAVAAREVVALRRPEPEPGPDTIESSAHTVEIDVAELKALIAAAQGGDPPGSEISGAHDSAADPRVGSPSASLADAGPAVNGAGSGPTTHRLAS